VREDIPVSASLIWSLESVAGRTEGMKEEDGGKCFALDTDGKGKVGNT
jgi:hypothetical protein